MVDRVLTEKKKQSIMILYQLSQSAQKDAWREIGEVDSTDNIAKAVRTRLQVRWMNNDVVDPPGWEEAAELVWIDPRGVPTVFVGGRDAFRWDEKQRRWTYVDGKVPGCWVVDTNYGPFGYCSHNMEQSNEAPLRVDRHDISREDLIELETIRRHEVQQSKIEVHAKVMALREAKSKRSAKQADAILKKVPG